MTMDCAHVIACWTLGADVFGAITVEGLVSIQLGLGVLPLI